MKTIAIQLNGTENDVLAKAKLASNALNITPIWFSLIPFSNEVVGAGEFNNYDDVAVFGSTKLVRLMRQGALPQSARIFYDEAGFDQTNYMAPLVEYLLNRDAELLTFGEAKHRVFEYPVFTKPTSDLKAFAGCIVEPGAKLGDTVMSKQYDHTLTDNENVLIAPHKTVIKEYRNFVVGGKLVGSSSYKSCGRVVWTEPSEAELVELAEFHDTIASLYMPMPTYVVDFARLESGELSVVEYNCLNCAGPYTVNLQRVYRAVLDEI